VVSRLAVGPLALLLLVTGIGWATARTQRPAPVGSDPFRGGAAYSGDFPDPTVMRVGSTYYAFSTAVAALNLPELTSTDLRHWTARRSADPDHPFQNDAMPTAAPWAERRTTGSGRVFSATWAPSVVRLGPGRFVAAYSVPRASDGHRCISVARASSPLGPFVDRSSAPVSCAGEQAIDPQIFFDRGVVWMLLKAGGARDRILVRRMNAAATAFVPGTAPHRLLTAKLRWEAGTVENPAMIRFKKRLYLFYSGNGFASARYATGYAVCRSVIGPCTRRGRLLSAGPVLVGQGGATPFRDRAGHLRLAYHAWRRGTVGYPKTDGCLQTSAGCAQRRLYVATLAVRRRTGALVLYRRW
jgi:beta-xylosidase